MLTSKNNEALFRPFRLRHRGISRMRKVDSLSLLIKHHHKFLLDVTTKDQPHGSILLPSLILYITWGIERWIRKKEVLMKIDYIVNIRDPMKSTSSLICSFSSSSDSSSSSSSALSPSNGTFTVWGWAPRFEGCSFPIRWPMVRDPENPGRLKICRICASRYSLTCCQRVQYSSAEK